MTYLIITAGHVAL